jgi:hypothetical protein
MVQTGFCMLCQAELLALPGKAPDWQTPEQEAARRKAMRLWRLFTRALDWPARQRWSGESKERPFYLLEVSLADAVPNCQRKEALLL